MSIITTLASNACQCAENDLNQGLEKLLSKVNTGVNKLAEMITGPLNSPINFINNTVLDAQHALATGFENQLLGLVKDITGGAGSTLNTSCFLKPFADFFGQVNNLIAKLAGIIGGLDLSLPTLDFKFQVALHVHVCGGIDTFTGPLTGALTAAGLGLGGTFPITSAFAGMNFPNADYGAKFKEMVSSVVNVQSMEKVMDNVVGAVQDRFDAVKGQIAGGVDAIKNWGDNAAKTVNSVIATVSDPAAALTELQNTLVPPSTVAWAAKFAGLFGITVPGVLGGDNPKKPRDVNYLTNKAIGNKINNLLQLNALHQSDSNFFNGLVDPLSGYHGLGTDEGLGAALKDVMGAKDSVLSDADFANVVKEKAAEMGVEAVAASSIPATVDKYGTPILRDVLGREVTSASAAAAAAQIQEAHVGLSELDLRVNQANADVITARVQSEQQDAAIRDLQRYRASSSLTSVEKNTVDQAIFGLEATKSQAQADLTKATAFRDSVERDFLDQGPHAVREFSSLSNAAGAIPEQEARFSPLRPVPGTAPREEHVDIPPTTSVSNVPGDRHPWLVEGDNLIAENQAYIANNRKIIEDGRFAFALGELPDGGIDAYYEGIRNRTREIELAQASNERIRARQATFEKQQAQVGPPSPGTDLSTRVASATGEGGTGARAFTLDEIKNAQQEPGLTLEQKFNPDVLTPLILRNRERAGTVIQAGTKSLELPTSEAVVQSVAQQNAVAMTRQAFLKNPGGPEATAARATLPNHEVLLAMGAATAIENREKVPPAWLATFGTTNFALVV